MNNNGETQLYPSIEPYQTEMLQVSDIHRIYVEQSGNPNGKPVTYLHGGPGAGTDPECRRLFDPAVYRIIIFDQRGCGKSLPKGCLVDNTTWALIEDMEQIREHLCVDTWQVFGGSWGSTLALAYAINHPPVITELVLRGIFLLRRKEILWFYQLGHVLFPDLFEEFIEGIPEEVRNDVIHAYYQRLTSEDKELRIKSARAWGKWEGSMLSVLPDPAREKHFSSDEFAEAFARIECHYFENRAFFPQDNYLLENIDAIRHIPTVIVQGRYDVITPFEAAWDLHKAFPEAAFLVIPDAGHAVTEPGIRKALLQATDSFGQQA
jgi:proline iminopeptidase